MTAEPVMGVAVPAPVVPAPLHDAWDLRSGPASTDLGVRDVAWDAISGLTSPTLVPPVSLVTPDQLQNTRARAQAARQPTRDVSRTLRWVANAVSAFSLSEPPPRNHKEALRRPDAEEWRTARRAELTALIELGVFREARRKRDGSQWLPAQWIYVCKANTIATTSTCDSELLAASKTFRDWSMRHSSAWIAWVSASRMVCRVCFAMHRVQCGLGSPVDPDANEGERGHCRW